MPKIIIREYDKTTAGNASYSNFDVVVPGFVKARAYVASKKAFMYGGKTVFKAESAAVTDGGQNIFDENDICKFSSVEEFENCIGKVAVESGLISAAVAPTVTSVNTLTAAQFIAGVQAGNVYTYTNNVSGEIGKLKDENYIYQKVAIVAEESGAISTDPEYNAQYEYAIISGDSPDNRGADAVYGDHYGNQIAYELLKLGYSVVFKKLTTLSNLGSPDFWSALKDKSLYDFRYIISGLLTDSTGVNAEIINLAEFKNASPENSGRGDCTALLDIDSTAYENKTTSEAVLAIEDLNLASSKYAAYFAPAITYAIKEDPEFGGNKTFPASFHYLACAARAAETFNEWYAIAGYTRGICDYAIESVGCNFGEAAINALEPRRASEKVDVAVNLIVKIRGNYYLWGNRTAEKLSGEEDGDLKASHFLNIRQLCTTIKKQVYVACRRFTFDPNSDVLWINFCNAIRPTLEKMKADQGIQDYKFVKVADNTKALLKAKIRIVPIEAVEDFDITLTLEDSVSGVDVDVEEDE